MIALQSDNYSLAALQQAYYHGIDDIGAKNINLHYINGHFVGMVDCNNYTVTVKSLLQPGFIDVLEQHIAITERKCDDPLAAHHQQRYFDQLADVTQFTYFAGKLALTYQINNHSAVMVFAVKKHSNINLVNDLTLVIVMCGS